MPPALNGLPTQTTEKDVGGDNAVNYLPESKVSPNQFQDEYCETQHEPNASGNSDLKSTCIDSIPNLKISGTDVSAKVSDRNVNRRSSRKRNPRNTLKDDFLW